VVADRLGIAQKYQYRPRTGLAILVCPRQQLLNFCDSDAGRGNRAKNGPNAAFAESVFSGGRRRGENLPAGENFPASDSDRGSTISSNSRGRRRPRSFDDDRENGQQAPNSPLQWVIYCAEIGSLWRLQPHPQSSDLRIDLRTSGAVETGRVSRSFVIISPIDTLKPQSSFCATSAADNDRNDRLWRA
jgi:hypothetical protein